MRVLLIEPGVHFSVQDVANGWAKGLAQVGCDVRVLNFGDRLGFYSTIGTLQEGAFLRAVDDEGAVTLAAQGIKVAAYEWWPDIVIIVSGFYVPLGIYELLRARQHKVVLIHTEVPYENERQLERAPYADLNVLNDPTGIDEFRTRAPSIYIPHAYDPDVHWPRPPKDDMRSDFAFVGTGYPSRVAFFEAVDWTGIDVALAGNWQILEDRPDSPLHDFVLHPFGHCVDNSDAVDLYCATKVSANIYRREAQAEHLSAGWSMGPREVELSACSCFYLGEARGENQEVLPWLPTFEDPDEFEELLRWYLACPDERQVIADKNRAALADRTFGNNAKRLLVELGI